MPLIRHQNVDHWSDQRSTILCSYHHKYHRPWRVYISVERYSMVSLSVPLSSVRRNLEERGGDPTTAVAAAAPPSVVAVAIGKDEVRVVVAGSDSVGGGDPPTA